MKLKSFLLLSILFSILLSCRKQGCIDASASNYDPEARKDNGTCIYIEDITPTVIQNKLIGTWSGGGVATFSGGITWQATFTIAASGHYSGHVTSVQSGSISSVFNNGNDNLDHPEKKFIIQSIDAFGKANGKVSFVHSGGSLLEYLINDLTFSDNYSKLNFEVAWGAELVYNLIRE